MLADLPDLRALTTFDATLREVPSDAAGLSAAIERARALVAAARRAGDEGALIRVLGCLGNACRILGLHDEAVAALREGVARAAASGNQRARLANQIRLAEAHKYRGEFARAETLLRQAVVDAQAPELAEYLDFALQHLGKCRLDQGDAAEACILLDEALRLRQRKGDPELLASTERALALARARLGAPAPPLEQLEPRKRRINMR